jgi:sugar lactone lactonase YvrE
VTLAGVVTTWAGSAQQSGSTDGNGSSARFNGPLGLAADAAGTLYVADCSNNIVRSVSGTQEVITLAGTPGNSGYVDGAPSVARFRCPSGLVVDGSGSNLYVADSNNHTVRRISLPSGNVSTYAGTPGAGGAAGAVGAIDGPVGTARFGRPYGLALDQLGDLVLTDAGNSEIRHIDLTNDVVATLSGSIGGRGYADGTGTAARFNDPHNIALDADGNLYVSDYANAVIRKITPDRVVSTLAGNPGVTGSADGTGSAARFGGPRGLSVDSAGNIFVADAANNTIRRITPQGAVTTFAGSASAGGYVNATGAAARFSNPVGVAVDSNSNVYVSDYNNNAIRKITPAGVVTTLAGGGPGSPGTTDGNGTAALFNGPRGVAVDGVGNVIVADRDNGTIRIVTPVGDVSTLAGSPGNSGYADGTGSSARFNWPNNPAVDAAGNIYVPDANNSAIRRVTPAGVVTTVVGNAPPGPLRTVVLGALPGGLNGPSGVVVIPGTPIRLVIAESAENALLIATLP